MSTNSIRDISRSPLNSDTFSVPFQSNYSKTRKGARVVCARGASQPDRWLAGASGGESAGLSIAYVLGLCVVEPKIEKTICWIRQGSKGEDFST